MAQLKRLTRRQKILLSRVNSGFKLPASTDPVDIAALERHGLIKLVDGRWVPTTDKQEG